MDSTESFSADRRELAARLLFSQERFAERYPASKNARFPKVLLACYALTAGFGKTSDRCHVSVIERQAGLPKGKASVVLRDLAKNGVIQWEKDKGQRTLGTLTLPPLSTIREHVEFQQLIARAKKEQA